MTAGQLVANRYRPTLSPTSSHAGILSAVLGNFKAFSIHRARITRDGQCRLLRN